VVAGDEQQTLSVSGGRPTGTRHLPAVGDVGTVHLRRCIYDGRYGRPSVANLTARAPNRLRESRLERVGSRVRLLVVERRVDRVSGDLEDVASAGGRGVGAQPSDGLSVEVLGARLIKRRSRWGIGGTGGRGA
jgi:hypothetical protein